MSEKKIIYFEEYIKRKSDKTVIKKISKKQRKGWMALPKKTRRAISLTVIILLLGVILTTGSFKLFKIAYKHSQQKVTKQLATYKKIKVVVGKGETVWELQEKLTPNEDIREMLDLATKYNNKSLGVVCEGEVITLLKK